MMGWSGPGKKTWQMVILSEAKNLAYITEILRFAQNDGIAKENCRTRNLMVLLQLPGFLGHYL